MALIFFIWFLFDILIISWFQIVKGKTIQTTSWRLAHLVGLESLTNTGRGLFLSKQLVSYLEKSIALYLFVNVVQANQGHSILGTNDSIMEGDWTSAALSELVLQTPTGKQHFKNYSCKKIVFEQIIGWSRRSLVGSMLAY